MEALIPIPSEQNNLFLFNSVTLVRMNLFDTANVFFLKQLSFLHFNHPHISLLHPTHIPQFFFVIPPIPFCWDFLFVFFLIKTPS